jgi:hypothetical protein
MLLFKGKRVESVSKANQVEGPEEVVAVEVRGIAQEEVQSPELLNQIVKAVQGACILLTLFLELCSRK